jgi:uncharacterized membrane protein HdeD (DUF308 family)
MTTPATPPAGVAASIVAAQVGQHATAMRVLAVAMLIAGLCAIALPVLAGLAFEMMVGWLLLFFGLVQAVTAWRGKGMGEFLTQLFFGILILFTGAYLLWSPVSGLQALTFVLTAFLLVEGITKLVVAFKYRGSGRTGMVALSGGISLLMGVLLLANLQTAWEWAIGLLVGIDLVFGGWSLLFFVSAAKRVAAGASA